MYVPSAMDIQGNALNLMTGHANLDFPTTCPSCDHSPVEADSCPPNKALRNTMRIWLQKQKKKEENKAASEAVAPAPETSAGPPSEVQPAAESAENPVESVEDNIADQTAADGVAEHVLKLAIAAPQREEVRESHIHSGDLAAKLTFRRVPPPV